MEEAKRILEKLELAIIEYALEEETAVLFSGGLDSTIVASLLAQYAPVKLYTVGKEGSFDMKMGRKTARTLHLPWKGLTVSHDEIIEGLSELIEILHVDNPVILSYELPLHLLSARVPEVHLFSGQGADELFGGYAKYLDMDEEEREARMDEDLSRVLAKGVSLEKMIVEHHGKEIHYPFLHDEVLKEVEKLPVDQKIQGETRKVLLREVAKLLELGEVVTRKKKAAQYGTGIMKSMKKEGKRRGTGVRGLIDQLAPDGKNLEP